MRASILAAVLLAACNPLAFDDLEDEAPVRALEAPDDYPGNDFGRVITAFEGTVDGEPVSSLAVTAGTDTPFRSYRVWGDGDVRLGKALIDGCDDETECAPGAGAALAGLPVWRAGTPDEGRMCLLVGAPTDSKIVIRCERGPHSGGEVLPGPTGGELGASAASLGESSPAGVAVIGAPAAGGGTGAIYRLEALGAQVEITSPDLSAALSGGARLGETLAATRLSDGSTAIAAGAPGDDRVVVLVLSDAGGSIDVSLRACIDGGDGFGSALAWGDVTGDGAPELFVGGDGGVHMVTGPVPDPGGCTDPGTVEVPCPSGLRDGIATCGGFGAALATGDVDGDGTSDLIAGAPNATVGGQADAGAVFVLAGGSGVPGAGADVLTYGSPESGDLLGTSVAAAATQLDGDERAEPAAGAPGRESVLVFLCSGLPGDTTQIGTRCIAR